MDFASLNLRVNTSSIAEGKSSIDAFANAARMAGAAVEKLEEQASATDKALSDAGESASAATDGLSAMAAAAAALAESEDAATKRIKDMVRASLDQQSAMKAAAQATQDASKANQGLGQSSSSSKSGDTLGASFAESQREIAALNDAMDHQSQSLSDLGERREWVTDLYNKGIISLEDSQGYMKSLDSQEKTLTKSINAHAAEVQNLIRQYDPISSALKKITEDEQKLEQAFKSGAITQEQYSKASAGLTVDRAKWQAEALAVNELSTGLKGLSLTSSFALREYTSMLNGLANGNLGQVAREAATLTVRSGALAAIMNPVGIAVGTAAASLGLFAAAAYQAEKESFELEKALVMSGDAAGVTAGQMQIMAKNIDSIVGTRGAAVETLALLASTGKVAGSNLQDFAIVAEKLQQTVGQPVAETVKIFDELGKDPVNASKKLQEQYGYLTGKTYDQIAALVKQGDVLSAGALAQKSYADAMSQRVTGLQSNMGTLQRAAKSVGNVFKEMWDSILDIGRSDSDSPEQKLAAIQKRIDELSKPTTSFLGIQIEQTNTGHMTRGGMTESELDGLKKQAAALQDVIKAQQDKAKSDAQAVADTNAHIVATELLNKVLKDQQSYNESLAKTSLTSDLASIQRELDQTKAAYTNYDAVLEELHSARQVSDKDYYAAKEAIIKNGTDAEVKAIDDEIARIKKNDADAQKALSARDDLTPEERYAAQNTLSLQEAADLQKINGLVVQRGELQAKAATQQTVLSLQEKAAQDAVVISYKQAADAAQSYLDVVTKQRDREIAGIGKGDQQRTYDSGLNSIDDRYTDTKKNLDDAQLRNQITKDEYDKRLEIANEFRQKDVDGYNTYWAELNAKQGSFFTGFTEASATFIDEANNVAKSSATAFGNAFTSMRDALVSFIQTGKLDFKTLADSIVADILRIQIQALEAKAITGLTNLFLGVASGTGSATNGGTYGSGGTVLSDSTLWSPHADGTNYIPYDGYKAILHKGEAVVPAKYNAAAGGAGGANVTINSTINTDSGTNVAQFNALLDQRDKQLKADLLDGIKRGRYGKLTN